MTALTHFLTAPLRERFDVVGSDMDGTLIDSEASFEKSWYTTLQARGVDTSDFDYNELRGLGGPESCRRIHARYGLDGTIEDFVDEWLAIARSIVFAEVKLCAGAESMLTLCEVAKLPKALVTTSAGPYTEKILTQVGLIDRFEFLVTRSTMEMLSAASKPEPGPYLLACWRFGVDPSRMLVFEDSEVGVKSAKAAGCPTVGISSGDSLIAEKLKVAGADCIVDTLENLDIQTLAELP